MKNKSIKKNKDNMNIIVEEENLNKINEDIILEDKKYKINNNEEKVKNDNQNNKIKDNYIIDEIYIKEKDINKIIRITNFFENYKRDNNLGRI